MMIMKKLTLLACISFLLASCAMPLATQGGIVAKPISYVFATPNPNATSTPTPFQPLPATATPTLAPATPTPEFTSTPEVRNWWTGLKRPEGQKLILLLGSDWRYGGGFRTDVIMLIALNPKENTAKIVSFPRDLYVSIPGVGQNRINVAQPYGGFELMAQTLEQNFGVRPDYYIMTNFDGFVSIINNVGGINVNAYYNLTDKCDLPQASYDGYCSVGPGTVYMDGRTALWYVRSRYSTSDFDRTRREQEVIYALFSKLLSLNAISRIPELYNIYQNSVETNINLETVVSLAPMAPILLEKDAIRRYYIGPQQVSSYIVPESGAAVLLPNDEAIGAVLKEAIFEP